MFVVTVLCLCWLFMSLMIYVMYICDIYVISSVCVDGIQKTNKKEPDMGTLPGGFFAECPRWHSAKMYSLLSAFG
jgi:hypothetical protein